MLKSKAQNDPEQDSRETTICEVSVPTAYARAANYSLWDMEYARAIYPVQ